MAELDKTVAIVGGTGALGSALALQLARAGVNVQVDRGYGSADAITKVASGAYDMAFADIGALIQFNGKQAGAKVVSVFQVYDAATLLIL